MRPALVPIAVLFIHVVVGASLAAASESSDLARAFVGHCITNAGRNDKIESSAEVFGYEELSGAKAQMFAPQDPNARFRGWMVKDDLSPLYALGISWSERNGIEMSNCDVANPDLDSEEVLRELQKIITMGNTRFDDDDAGQRYRIWGTDNIAPNSFISLIDAKKLGIDGGTFAFSSPTEK